MEDGLKDGEFYLLPPDGFCPECGLFDMDCGEYEDKYGDCGHCGHVW